MKRGVAFAFILLTLISFASADFEIGNLSHKLTKTVYGEGANLLGWINISLEDENSDSLVTANYGEISLIDLLNLNSGLKNGTDYHCSSPNCLLDYSATNAETTKSFSLNSGDSKLLGIVFDSKINQINSVKFNVSSNAGSSCRNQIEIDFFADGEIEAGNTNIGTETCGSLRNEGCFNSSETLKSIIITNLPNLQCGKIELPAAPGFNIGANIQRNGDTKNITIGLYYPDNSLIEGTDCILPTTNGEVSCEIKYPILEPTNYSICIHAETGSTSKINYETVNPCGFIYSGGTESKVDFEIFGEPLKFGQVETISINNTDGSGNALNSKIQEYLISTYGLDLPCENNCYVPILIESNINQNIEIQGIEIRYAEEYGNNDQDQLYDLEKTSPTIDSDFLQINFDSANFTARETSGNMTLRVELNDEKIFSETISIQELPSIKRVYPTTIAQGFATEITAILDSDLNASKYIWSFGDGANATTSTNKVTKIYNTTKTYNLQIWVGEGEKTSFFSTTIDVISPEAKINSTLQNFQANLEKIKIQLDSFDSLSKERLENFLNLSYMEDTLEELQKEYAQATTNAEYLEIVYKLEILDIPSSIIKTKNAESITFSPNEDSINLEALRLIGGGEYESSEINGYKSAISGWIQESINLEITYKEFSSQEKLLLNVFSLKLTEKDLQETGYIIIKDLTDLSFDKNYGEEEESGNIYIEFSDLPKTISFSTTQEVDFTNLPLFISPSISSLQLIEGPSDSGEKAFKWTLLFLVLFLLIIIGVSAYLFLQVWYKKKYEKYLFKDQNNMYNLIHYINNEKKQGKKDKEISKNLRKVGWNLEQISYVMKKYSGKRTGMYELPLGKFLEKKVAPKAPTNNLSQKPRMPGQMQKRFFPEDKFKRY
ncbi:hypothetical protein HOD88_03145 [archaeon]|jgi:hypothetical protein|nr:hypothetical protein [archaeon]